ncbi:MAG: hypothetical protein HZC54_13310 [Verrucomicrobia bacterium]|nr:hypothetical protein [Verrucomicrobiota bacterium]
MKNLQRRMEDDVPPHRVGRWPVMKQPLPQEAKCVGMRVLDSELVVCLANPAGGCGFSMTFGSKRFCCHRQHLKFAARAKASPLAAAGRGHCCGMLCNAEYRHD